MCEKTSKPEVVLKRLADVGEHEDGVDGMVELGEGADAGSHHAAHVEAEDDVLAMLALVDGGDRLAAPRGRLPAHVLVVVVGDVVAVVAELAAGARQALRPVAARPHQRGPHQGFVAANFEQVGEDLHRLGRRHSPLRPGQAERPAAAQMDRTERKVAALGGEQTVRRAGPAVARHADSLLHRVHAERGGRLVAHHQPQPPRPGVLQDQDHLVIDADREPSRPLAAHPQSLRPARPRGQERVADEGQHHQSQVTQGQPVQPAEVTGAGQPTGRRRKGADEHGVQHRVGQANEMGGHAKEGQQNGGPGWQH